MKASLNFSNFSKNIGPFDKNSPEYSSGYSNYKKYYRIAGSFGLASAYNITDAFSVGAELSYNGRGSAYRAPNNSVILIGSQGSEKAYDYFKLKINYLEFSLTFKYDFTAKSSSNNNFILYGGLAPAVAISKKTTLVTYSGSGNSIIANEVSHDGDLNYVRTFNISPIIGFETGTKREGKANMFIDVRYSRALLPVFTDKSYSDGSNMKTSMQTLGIGIGVKFK